MKSSDIDQELFTESYCKVCSAQLISESQRVAHYEGSDNESVDKNKCCTLCNMSFTSAVVAESHYQGKIHAKRLKLLLGEQPTLKATETNLSSLKQSHLDSSPVVSSPHQRRDSDRYCQLCTAWFNNPMMAQQHYDGKKHKKNAARADLLEQLGKTLDLGELRGCKHEAPRLLLSDMKMVRCTSAQDKAKGGSNMGILQKHPIGDDDSEKANPEKAKMPMIGSDMWVPKSQSDMLGKHSLQGLSLDSDSF
ncbi:zinc finger matrin-type protein 4 isoform X2 [Podarcis raffonei]|uniref:zinc finger matrin-type protein 4 isoform X2 n=1 Tax=Podarcis raffonei TaxID=65483 RepID=UPI0023295238|nr:zinc finger matrin-type protein 4 isoform X2 [Podarcis raffonei]